MPLLFKIEQQLCMIWGSVEIDSPHPKARYAMSSSAIGIEICHLKPRTLNRGLDSRRLASGVGFVHRHGRACRSCRISLAANLEDIEASQIGGYGPQRFFCHLMAVMRPKPTSITCSTPLPNHKLNTQGLKSRSPKHHPVE